MMGARRLNRKPPMVMDPVAREGAAFWVWPLGTHQSACHRALGPARQASGCPPARRQMSPESTQRTLVATEVGRVQALHPADRLICRSL